MLSAAAVELLETTLCVLTETPGTEACCVEGVGLTYIYIYRSFSCRVAFLTLRVQLVVVVASSMMRPRSAPHFDPLGLARLGVRMRV